MLARGVVLSVLLAAESAAAVRLGAVRQIGGSSADSVAALTRDSAGNLYLTGKTYSIDFPATTGQTRPGGSTLWRITNGGAQLTPLFGHGGAGVHALAASGSALFVFTGSALLKSTDGGATFAPCDSTLPAEPNGGAIALDGDAVYLALPSTGIFKSTDSCGTFHKSFQGITSGSPSQAYPDQIAIDPNRRSTLFASTGFNLYRSDDGGATWQHQAVLRRNLVFDPAHPGVIYASDPYANYRSADRGATWTAVAPFGSGGVVSGLGVDSRGKVYGDDGRDLYLSTDGGASWLRRQTFGGTRLFAADPDSGFMYALAGDGIFASDDGFATYQTVEYYQVAGITSLAFSHGGIFTGSPTPTSDAFVAKLDSVGDLVWATYLGGPYDDYATAIAVAPNGDVVICGNETGIRSFIARFTNDGALLYSKRVTDSNSFPLGITTDSAGDAYIAGTTFGYAGLATGSLPVTPGAAQQLLIPSGPTAPVPFFQPQDAFACKLDPDATIVYCTYLGSGSNAGTTIAVDPDGCAYVAGGATVWKLNAGGSAMVYTQSIAGAAINAGALDGRGSWIVGGSTRLAGFPTTAGAFQRVLKTRPQPDISGVLNGYTEGDAFVTRLDASTGGTIASTLLGGEASDAVNAIAAGADGTVTVAGSTLSRTFPLRGARQTSFASSTAFVTRLTGDLSALVFSTYAGDTHSFAASGVTVADDGSVFFAGSTAGATGNVFVAQLIPGPAALPELTAVLNAASQQGTNMAPNQILNVIAPGAGPDAAMLVDGVPLPVLSSKAGVIVAQVPADFQSSSAVQVTVQAGGGSSMPLLMPGAAAAPAIYTQDDSGTGLGVIFNEDGSLNTTDNPAAPGSEIAIACNGIGLDTPVKVYIDGSLAQFLDATAQALPGLPGNVVVVRARIPVTKLPALVSVMLNVGGINNVSGILSPPYVAVAIQQ
jgi:uncharacterized protein (TIGR03437 family)